MSVPTGGDPVDVILTHALLAVDGNGPLCACGDRTDRLEHLAAVALGALGAPASARHSRPSRAKAAA